MTEAGRVVFDAFPDWVKVTFYAAAAIAVVVFLAGIWLRVRRYLLGRPSGRWDHLVSRAVGAVRKLTLFRSRIWRDDPYAGLAHEFVMWGFSILFLGTAILTVDADITMPLTGTSFLQGDVYLVYSFFLDTFGVIFLIGVLMMVARRGLRRTSRLAYAGKEGGEGVSLHRFIMDDRAFLSLLLLAAVGGFMAEGLRIHLDGTTFAQEWSPVGVGIASLIGALGLSRPVAFDLYLAVWWIHAVGALAFVAYLPFSKAFHVFAGFGSLMFADERAGKALDAPHGGEPAGYSRLSDFTRVQLLNLSACVRCGRCHDVCPAEQSGLPLSPRGLMAQLSSHVARLKGGAGRAVVGNAIDAPTLWSCTTCLACMDACPLQIEHVPFIVDMRRFLVTQGQVDRRLQTALMNLSRYGNSLGKAAKSRGRWSEQPEGGVKDARRQTVEYLWFIGDYASFDPRLQETTRQVARVFSRSGVDFGTMGETENNSGNDARRVGEEGLFESLRDHNVEAMKACKFRDIVTTDPHTYNTLRNEYPLEDGGRVLHYTELLDELIRSGRLRFSKRLPYRVTYHDPCYLGRYNGVYDAPRRVLSATGVDLVEMPRNRRRSLCCGAGGGRIWMEETSGGKQRPADIRIKEAAALEGVGVLVVACPKDYVMFADAVKAAGLEGSLQVRDIIELVEEAL